MNRTCPIPRRRFLLGGLVFAGAGAFQIGPVSGQTLGTGRLFGMRRLHRLSLAMFKKEDFESCLGTSFTMEIQPGQAADLELIEVSGSSKAANRPGADREPFSLLFRGPLNLDLAQRIFRLNHPQLGVHEIFLVPLGPDEKGTRFEAVFS